MTSASHVSALAAYLNHLHDDDHLSWRKIRDREFPGISHTVLRDLAVEGKVPREWRVLVVLGLAQEPRPLTPHERRVRRKIGKLAKETREKATIYLTHKGEK
jgi:hypothetical protein